ncbi:MAG TPA: hypothetical protein VMN38_03585 [Sphingomicrobium sp.]|nr:hypothetical protein [Sphingomicrobium sp.]
MWPFKRKKSEADMAIEWMPRAIGVAAHKWIEFESQPFAQEMDLEQKLFLFTEGLGTGLKQWQAFKGGPDALFLLIAAKGIERSRTHLRLELEAVLKFAIPGPHERSDDEEMAELKSKLIDRVSRKWAYFAETLVFKPEVSLEERIRSFKIPFLEGVRRDFPMFREAQDNELDALIALGIDQTGTHSILEVQRALGLDL